MTLTSRIRLYLILIATLPVLIVMLLIWLQLGRQSEQTDQRTAERALARYETEWKTDFANLIIQSGRLTQDRSVSLALERSGGKQVSGFNAALESFDLDFAEIVDSTGIVLASVNRPGLLDQPVHERFRKTDTGNVWLETIEFDRHGPHAACTMVSPLGNGRYLYAGQFIDSALINRAATLLDADVNLVLEPDSSVVYAEMSPRELYRTDSGFQAVLLGSGTARFYLTAQFVDTENSSTMLNLIGIAGLIGLISVLLSILLGLYITGRAKREIDNLVQATERVSKGDLNTPIMAYEEGEFSKLADSFSQMLIDLKRLQIDLATSEKIAAWQTMGRKIAHEIKNPMTPIAISADDLRRSYQEKLPDFDRILVQTTGMIKSEVSRLNRLLDQFVGFARMAPPDIRSVDMTKLFEELAQFFSREIESGRLEIINKQTTGKFLLDRDNIWQVMINLIKNSFETENISRVTLTASGGPEELAISIEDDGPGFTEQILSNSFQPHISTRKGGSGLGLVICYRIVRDHNGQMSIYNRPEGGAGVSITIPA